MWHISHTFVTFITQFCDEYHIKCDEYHIDFYFLGEYYCDTISQKGLQIIFFSVYIFVTYVTFIYYRLEDERRMFQHARADFKLSLKEER